MKISKKRIGLSILFTALLIAGVIVYTDDFVSEKEAIKQCNKHALKQLETSDAKTAEFYNLVYSVCMKSYGYER